MAAGLKVVAKEFDNDMRDNMFELESDEIGKQRSPLLLNFAMGALMR